MATAKNINRSTDPNVRKSPPLSANAFPVDHVAKGNDGNQWIITESGNGIKRWAPLTKTASKSSSKKSSTSQAASSTNPVYSQQEALDRFNSYLNNVFDIYYTLPKTNIAVYVDSKLNIRSFQALIGNNIIVDESDPDFKKQLQDWLSQRTVIKNPKILSDSRADMTHFTFEFDPNADIVEKEDELNDLDQWLYDKMNVRDGIQLPAAVQSSSTNQLKDFVDGLSNIGSLYYEMKETKVKVFQVTTGSGTSYQFVIELDTGTNTSLIATNLKKYIADQESIERNVSITNPIGKILIVVFEFRDNYTTLIKKEDLDRIDNYLIPRINIKASTTSNSLSKFKVDQFYVTQDADTLEWTLNYISDITKLIGKNDNLIQLTECKSGESAGLIEEKSFQDSLNNKTYIHYYIPQIGDIISIKPTGITDFTYKIVNIDLSKNEIEVESSTSGVTNSYYTKEQFNELLIKRGIEVLNFDPNARRSNIQTAVQEAETKVDDIVFSAPVVPVGTEDQRNATDKLVDEFIAKNENNLKKLSVENVGLLSTIDKTLEFIKAKFGTPAAISSVSNVVSTAPQPQFITGDIDYYKLMQFIGNDGERKVTEFQNFTTGKNASVFKYLIGDIFIVDDKLGPQKNYIYVLITGAIENGINQGNIEYLESYLGNLDKGLTWNPKIHDISVSEFDSYIEDKSWIFIPGANENLNKISSAVSNASKTANRSFELGDVVKIKSDSQYFGTSLSNPANVEGVVIEINRGAKLPIRVQWPNGRANSYPVDDLEFSSQSIFSAPVQATPITTISKRSYELGNKVILSPSSRFYKANDPFNPIDTEGIIVDVDKRSTYPYKVEFSTGKKNSYKAKDLLLVTTKLSTSTSTTSIPVQLSKQAPAVTTTAGGSAIAGVGDTVIFFASREKTNLQGIVKAIVTGTDGKPYLRINVNGKFYLKQQGSVKKV